MDLYLEGPINADMIYTTIHQLRIAEENGVECTLYVNTPGGDAVAAFAMVDFLREMKRPPKIIVVGMACSAGFIITVCGGSEGKRFITKNSTMMGHMPRGRAHIGTVDVTDYGVMRDDQIALVAESTGRSVEDIAKLLKLELFINADEALEHGFVDTVL